MLRLIWWLYHKNIHAYHVGMSALTCMCIICCTLCTVVHCLQQSKLLSFKAFFYVFHFVSIEWEEWQKEWKAAKLFPNIRNINGQKVGALIGTLMYERKLGTQAPSFYNKHHEGQAGTNKLYLTPHKAQCWAKITYACNALIIWIGGGGFYLFTKL